MRPQRCPTPPGAASLAAFGLGCERGSSLAAAPQHRLASPARWRQQQHTGTRRPPFRPLRRLSSRVPRESSSRPRPTSRPVPCRPLRFRRVSRKLPSASTARVAWAFGVAIFTTKRGSQRWSITSLRPPDTERFAQQHLRPHGLRAVAHAPRTLPPAPSPLLLPTQYRRSWPFIDGAGMSSGGRR